MYAVCSQFVAMHPAHARLSEAAYWVVRHLVALFCPGTWLTLEVSCPHMIEVCAQFVATHLRLPAYPRQPLGGAPPHGTAPALARH